MKKTIIKIVTKAFVQICTIIFIALFWAVRAARVSLTGIEWTLGIIGVQVGICEAEGGDERKDSISFEQKFSEDELLSMARSIKSLNLTIQEIQNKFGISYRQARKVQSKISECQNPLIIHKLSAT